MTNSDLTIVHHNIIQRKRPYNLTLVIGPLDFQDAEAITT